MKQDPLALAFFAAALAVLAGLILYAAFFFKTPASPPGARAFDFLREKLAGKPAAQPQAQSQAQPQAPHPQASQQQPVPKGPVIFMDGKPGYPVHPLYDDQMWVYQVTVEPPAWQNAVLAYRTQRQGKVQNIQADFSHASGRMRFSLGPFRAGEAMHANSRFPGFFLYPAYFGERLEIGQKLAWEWPWQLPDGRTKPGRVKRFEGRVVRAEQYTSAAIPMSNSLRIDLRIDYVEDGSVRASVRESILYALKAAQVVHIVREGRSPDEGSTRIVAELTELR